MADEEAFAAFFAAHYGAVLAYGLRRVDPDTARDVAAETFLVAWRRLAELAAVPPTEPSAWLLAVARKVLANEIRRRNRVERLTERMTHLARAGGADPVHPDHADAVVGTERILAAMSRLSARDREVLQLVAWEGLDHTAAAVVLECSPSAAKVRLHRARRRLSALLQRHDTSDTDGTLDTDDIHSRARQVDGDSKAGSSRTRKRLDARGSAPPPGTTPAASVAAAPRVSQLAFRPGSLPFHHDKDSR